MQVFEKIKETREFIRKNRAEGKSIGFVPTMGALHEGHLSLMECATTGNDIVAVSVFVNPAQFNNPEDLKKYPRDLQGDLKKMEQLGVDLVFAPAVEEMYPEEVTRTYDFGGLDRVMEGQYRPGHFNGVAVVVHKLFEIITPDKAYFGEKDYQQLAIIRKLAEIENLKVKVIGSPIVRETDGLAMSSRNSRLSKEERAIAPVIYKTLKKATSLRGTKTVEEVRRFVHEEINNTEKMELEYFEIADSKTLTPIDSWEASDKPRGFVAAYLGNVRLIDNMAFN